jgi:hypothetical protein
MFGSSSASNSKDSIAQAHRLLAGTADDDARVIHATGVAIDVFLRR